VTRAAVLAAAAGVAAAFALAELLAVQRAARGSGRHPGRGPRRGSRVTPLLAALTRLGARARPRSAPADLEARLAAAGTPLGLAVGDVVALKAGMALVGSLLAVPLGAALPGRLGLLVLVTAPVAGLLAPDVLLARRVRARRAAMAREVADVLDLVRVAVGAGLPAGRALGEVGRRQGGLLGAELRRAADELALGVPRAETLARLVARCPVPEVAGLVAAVGRADRHGAPLGPALESLAAEARAEGARRVRDAAARAAPRIQLVVALVLVPAVMLLVGAALLLALGAPAR
jgi:tight adherence protein C